MTFKNLILDIMPLNVAVTFDIIKNRIQEHPKYCAYHHDLSLLKYLLNDLVDSSVLEFNNDTWVYKG